MAELFQAFLASQLTNQRNEEEKESEREATYLDRFLKLKPMKFYGTPDSDKAETWIKNIKKKLDILKVPAKNRIKLATHVMEGEADSWWDTVCDQNTNKEMSWEDFEQHFYDRYFPVALKQTRIKEFFELEQGNMTVAEYVSKYTELGKYALEQDHLSFLKKKASAGASGGNKSKKNVRKESGSSNGSGRPSKRQAGPECYTCGEFGHISPKCPKREGSGSAVVNRPQVQHGAKTETVKQPLRNQQASQKINQGNQGRGAQNRVPMKERGRVYALTEDDEATASNKMVLNGTILFSNTEVRILFDTGASHSFLSVCLASSLGLKPEPVTKPLTLTVPLLGKISINQIFKGCKLMVKDQVLTADLYPLEKTKYELI
ncbi:hypothetical protein FF1_047137 [Malus domestica]